MKEVRARLAKQHAGYMDLLKAVARDRGQLDAEVEAFHAERDASPPPLPPDVATRKVRELEDTLTKAGAKIEELILAQKALQKERDDVRGELARARSIADRALAAAIPPMRAATLPEPPPPAPRASKAPPPAGAGKPTDALDGAFAFLNRFPRQRVDSMFGKIAIENKLATHEQITECLEMQSFMESPVPIVGVLLMRKGYMKRQDVYRVLELVGKRLGGS